MQELVDRLQNKVTIIFPLHKAIINIKCSSHQHKFAIKSYHIISSSSPPGEGVQAADRGGGGDRGAQPGQVQEGASWPRECWGEGGCQWTGPFVICLEKRQYQTTDCWLGWDYRWDFILGRVLRTSVTQFMILKYVFTRFLQSTRPKQEGRLLDRTKTF